MRSLASILIQVCFWDLFQHFFFREIFSFFFFCFCLPFSIYLYYALVSPVSLTSFDIFRIGRALFLELIFTSCCSHRLIDFFFAQICRKFHFQRCSVLCDNFCPFFFFHQFFRPHIIIASSWKTEKQKPKENL